MNVVLTLQTDVYTLLPGRPLRSQNKQPWKLANLQLGTAMRSAKHSKGNNDGFTFLFVFPSPKFLRKQLDLLVIPFLEPDLTRPDNMNQWFVLLMTNGNKRRWDLDMHRFDNLFS